MKFSISEYLGFSNDDMLSILEREGYTKTELETLKEKAMENTSGNNKELLIA